MWEKYGKVRIKTSEELFEVEYFLCKYCDKDDSPYSVKLEKHSYTCEDETAESKPIFISRDEAEDFLDLLIRNKVTPETLQDIIDDMFGNI